MIGAIGKVALGTGIFGGVTYALKNQMEYAVKSEMYPYVNLEDTTVSVQLATLNEQHSVVDTLKSLVQQRLYQENRDNIELVLVDSHSDDLTVRLAKPYVDRIVDAPRGVLNTRTEGIKSTDADIIVTVDSDDTYPPNFLNMLLRHFNENPDVVATTGVHLYKDTAALLQTVDIWANLLMSRLQGCGTAFYRDAFNEVGGWDLSIDQFNINRVFEEEEINLYYRLAEIGKVIKDLQALVYASPRRFECNGELDELNQYCSAIREGQRF